MNSKLIRNKQIITERYFEAINISNLKLFEVIANNQEKCRPIYPLVEFIIERLETVTTLVLQERLWDAEIILRSALEVFIKLMFITSSDENEQQNLLNEFWNDLGEINALKESEQAKKNLQEFGHIEIHKLAFSPLLLPEEFESQLKNKWTRVNRQKVEQKWSFTEIVKYLSKNYRGSAVSQIVGLLHSYRIGSHLAHGDETAILVIAERRSRSEEQQEIVNSSHYLRFLSDSFSFCNWAARETMMFIKEDPKFFIELGNSLKDIDELSEKCQQMLFDDPDYNKYRTTEG